MKKYLVVVLTFFVGALLISTNAGAGQTDWNATAHVTQVEASYMPNTVTFVLDATAGPCSAGQTLEYDGQGPDAPTQQANAQAVYALLLAHKLSGQSVLLYGSNTQNGSGFCVVFHVIAH